MMEIQARISFHFQRGSITYRYLGSSFFYQIQQLIIFPYNLNATSNNQAVPRLYQDNHSLHTILNLISNKIHIIIVKIRTFMNYSCFDNTGTNHRAVKMSDKLCKGFQLHTSKSIVVQRIFNKILDFAFY